MELPCVFQAAFLVYCMAPTKWNGSVTIYNQVITQSSYWEPRHGKIGTLSLSYQEDFMLYEYPTKRFWYERDHRILFCGLPQLYFPSGGMDTWQALLFCDEDKGLRCNLLWYSSVSQQKLHEQKYSHDVFFHVICLVHCVFGLSSRLLME